MSRLCERPGCAEPATVAYGFDPTERMVWLAMPRDDGPTAGGLCRRHADAMVLPRGWWLDDRRGGADALFAAPEEPPEPEPAAEPARPKATRSRKRKPADAALPGTDVAPAVGPTPEVPAEPAEAAWTPSFDASDDLGGQLQAATPLLSRAFGGGTTLPPTPSRSRKKPSPGPVG